MSYINRDRETRWSRGSNHGQHNLEWHRERQERDRVDCGVAQCGRRPHQRENDEFAINDPRDLVPNPGLVDCAAGPWGDHKKGTPLFHTDGVQAIIISALVQPLHPYVILRSSTEASKDLQTIQTHRVPSVRFWLTELFPYQIFTVVDKIGIFC